jgi:hypothetical protein
MIADSRSRTSAAVPMTLFFRSRVASGTIQF